MIDGCVSASLEWFGGVPFAEDLVTAGALLGLGLGLGVGLGRRAALFFPHEAVLGLLSRGRNSMVTSVGVGVGVVDKYRIVTTSYY